MARLTPDQWETIRAEREAGASFPEIAKRFYVSHQAIQRRAKKEGWMGAPETKRKTMREAVADEKMRLARVAELRLIAKNDKAAKEANAKSKGKARQVITFERAIAKGGNVYIVFCEHAGSRWYKIGVAKDFAARLAVIQTGCPLKVAPILYGWVNAARSFEAKMHDKFAKSRVSGEWFCFSKSDAAKAVRLLTQEINKSMTVDMGALWQD